MASKVTTTTFDNVLKVLYPNGLETQWHKKSPFLAWIPKKENFTGSSKQINPLIGGTQTAATLATAIANKATPTHKKFNVTRVKIYQAGEVENEVIKASKGDKGAIAEAFATSLKGANYGFGRTLTFHVLGDGTGTRATVSAYASSVISLSSRYDVVKFEIGDKLVKKNSGGTLLAGGMTITAINPNDSGTAKLTVTLTGGAADPAANDTLAYVDDYTASVPEGVFSWCPVSAPSSTAFFGVDRTANTSRLAGVRMLGGGKSIEEIVFDACAEAAINGSDVDTLWLNSFRFSQLCKSAYSKAWIASGSNATTVSSARGRNGKAALGFSGFSFPSPKGPIAVMPDANMPYAYALLTTRSAWELCSLDGQPHFARDLDGKRFHQSATSDSIEYRLAFYGNLICKRPLDNVVIDLDN